MIDLPRVVPGDRTNTGYRRSGARCGRSPRDASTAARPSPSPCGTWKADVRRDLGDDLTRAQETILEAAAQAWVILSSLHIARQPSLVTRERTLLPVVVQRMQVADSLARHLERLGLERRAKDGNLAAQFAALHAARQGKASEGGSDVS